eukprot:TRINITY_DN26628_c0_g1_i2.p1 TRINITY_DN26628_c0_g1~~TRINITY_DN26628_c0_g1_i2.p1  ORF type:complete len:380 (-),score=83.46 TRINITY_DN26628_c0_g1_i2:120-1259(-)
MDTKQHSAVLRQEKSTSGPQDFVPASVGFVSPEQVSESHDLRQFGENRSPSNPFLSDVFGVGAIMMMMLTGVGMREISLMAREEARLEFVAHSLEHSFTDGLSNHARNLVLSMLSDESDRPTIHEVLNHAWFSDELSNCCQLGWNKSLDRMTLKGSESVEYEAGDWFVSEACSPRTYIIPARRFPLLYIDRSLEPGSLDGWCQSATGSVPIGAMTLEQKEEYSSWEQASKLGMELYWHNPTRSDSLVLVTEDVMQQLSDQFYTSGQRAKFVCDPLYPAQTGECVVSGQLPWNHDVAVFVRDKALASLDDFEQITTASDAEWECVRMREKAIFGKQMPFAGSVGVNRALHPHVPGKSSAFAFRAKDSMKAATILLSLIHI